MASDLKVLFPVERFPEQDPELLLNFIASFVDWTVALRRPTLDDRRAEDRIFRSIYWTTYSGARFLDPSRLSDGPRLDLGTRQENDFREACVRLGAPRSEVDDVAAIIDRHYIAAKARDLRVLLTHALSETLGAQSGILYAEEISARVLKTLRLAMWDGTVHALYGRVDRVQKVQAFLETHCYTGTLLVGCDNLSNVVVLTAPLSQADRYIVMRNAAFS